MNSNGNNGDYRTLDKLINGDNNTSNDKSMWLIPYTFGDNHFIYIDFKTTKEIKGIWIYNYNKSIEDTYRGTKSILIRADGKLMTPKWGVVVKKSLGLSFDSFD